MTLTHLKVANAKPEAKPYRLTDGDSLYLVVQPNGAKLWRMNYRYLGRQKTLHVGTWPAVSISAAREKRDGARRQLAAGLDRATEKKVALTAAKVAANNTFRGVAEEWVVKNEREGRATVTLEKIRWLLKMAYPVIGHLPIAQISPQDALTVMRKVEATGRYESARRMRSVLSRVFRYAIATARAQRDVHCPAVNPERRNSAAERADRGGAVRSVVRCREAGRNPPR